MPRDRSDVHSVPAADAEWLAIAGVRDAGGHEPPAWSVDEALALVDGAGHAAVDRADAEVLFPDLADKETV